MPDVTIGLADDVKGRSRLRATLPRHTVKNMTSFGAVNTIATLDGTSISLCEARATMLAAAVPLDSEELSLDAARGRVLASTIRTREDLIPCSSLVRTLAEANALIHVPPGDATFASVSA